MVSTLRTVRYRAPPSAPPGQPLLPTFAQLEQQNASQGGASTQQASQDPQQPAQDPLMQPVSPEEMASQVKELSHDLVQKEQQLETLIKALPGIGNSEQKQLERMRELERQLEEAEAERGVAVKERDELIRQVERAIMKGVGGI